MNAFPFADALTSFPFCIPRFSCVSVILNPVTLTVKVLVAPSGCSSRMPIWFVTDAFKFRYARFTDAKNGPFVM